MTPQRPKPHTITYFTTFILIFFAILPSASPESIFAQEARSISPEEQFQSAAKNTIFIEGLGNGGLYSFNYDRRILPFLNLRIGFSNYNTGNIDLFNVVQGSAGLVAIPVLASYMYNFPESASYLELGGGITSAILNAGTTTVPANGSLYVPIPTLAAMYRIMPANGGFSFRIGLTPLLLPGFFLPLIGVSIGWTFGGF